ncbi:helix-turn-helix transcriptional regulator [Proteus faecis]|uniref:Helix-turn-helix domain-containing protein n=2 Tax=Morganellaceae TaxID=1903414 RepID=A0AAW7CPN2_9GAMM|nr:helix-turn-helix transcriptional regulator [Proteus faecis]MBG3014160.1 helix-turn-helix transcriptional regulator [Proteus mirabilis]MDO5404261.1 helix-turn-helix transcriptional regulator [Proteus sp. (in: enterobacteria)]QNH65336.1 helix-turn-helix transcriptional regulator [Proteus vulgaris]MCT8250222.1 helix-turn-helix domain-containing protein [Proteus faecis]MDL5168106.1 helix-turn-helix transcriptional regulator [Proteus faecis]
MYGWNINYVIGNEVKAIRKAKKLTGINMSKKMNISQQHYSRLERGDVKWSVSTLVEVCFILNISILHFIKILDSKKRIIIDCNCEYIHKDKKM